MGKLDKCEYWYDKDNIEKDITRALSYQQDERKSIAFSLSAISKSLYNIMVMMDKEGSDK